ncbi:MAG: isoprenylcysteine carboxylmethyltransferase family protein, partial [Desulfobacterales bacterium]|nr:isoprenylcysteine carboxylmethyltransferase family protein [Desulfobacterales bacterium]
MLQLKAILFIIAFIGITWISRSSLRDFHSHGFYRFFAWIVITGLILLNINYWFYEPFRLHQIISWILLIISLPLVVQGVRLLRKEGKPDKERTDPSLVGFEKTTELVTEGIYR